MVFIKTKLLLPLNLLFLVNFAFGAYFNRSSFPRDFIFGTGGSSYQYEGAYDTDGRGMGIWDTFTHDHPERIADGGNGDVANDHYHRYKEDVSIMKDMGTDAFRLSISWPRILPKGKLSKGVNKKGIQFYNNLINELLSNGQTPYVTLFHWDVPQALEDEYRGFLSSRIVSDFRDFVDVCYKEFGDRVKYWATLNEPYTFSNTAYNLGVAAPGRCSKQVASFCSEGNSATEPYIVSHNLLLSHAAAVKLYKEKYQAHQKGAIGITNVINWMEPLSEASKVDRTAAQRVLDFQFGWFMDPIVYGKYPKTMESLVGSRLPKFTKEQSDMLKGSYDFIGLNYYTTNYAAHIPFVQNAPPSYNSDLRANLTTDRNGIPIGPRGYSVWLYSYPRGIYDILVYTKEKYKNPTIHITENGIDEVNNSTLPLDEALVDNDRVEYHERHLQFVLRAMMKGVNVKAYFAWSLLDNFEWISGYTSRFGMVYIDFQTLKRYPKKSAIWYKKFLLH